MKQNKEEKTTTSTALLVTKLQIAISYIQQLRCGDDDCGYDFEKKKNSSSKNVRSNTNTNLHAHTHTHTHSMNEGKK